MIHDHGSFSHARFPAQWGEPPYQMGDRVYADSLDNPGTVTGLMFFRQPNHDGIGQEEVGWWLQIELDEHARRYHSEPVLICHPTVIRSLPTKVQPSYPDLVTV